MIIGDKHRCDTSTVDKTLIVTTPKLWQISKFKIKSFWQIMINCENLLKKNQIEKET